MIELNGVTVRGNRKKSLEPILKNISIRLESRSIIIGPNGSGKTTLLKAIMGLIDYQGNIGLKFDSVIGDRPIINTNLIEVYKIIKANVNEIINFYSETMDSEKEKILDVIEKLRLTYILDKGLIRLSTGESKLLGFALAMGLKGDLTLLDEPFENLDISRKETVVSMINSCKKDLLVVTHDLQTIKKINLSRFYLMLSGKLEGGLPLNEIDKFYINLKEREGYILAIKTGSRTLWITKGDGEYPLFSFNSVDELIGGD